MLCLSYGASLCFEVLSGVERELSLYSTLWDSFYNPKAEMLILISLACIVIYALVKTLQ